jgi:hypothetical protein
MGRRVIVEVNDVGWGSTAEVGLYYFATENLALMGVLG